MRLNSEQSCERQGGFPGTYLLTFACYGARLRGEPGAVDRLHNTPGAPRLEESAARAASQRQRMIQTPYLLSDIGRTITLRAIEDVCAQKSWTLLAAHVRTNHVHVVIEADAPPEWVMSTLKRFASRALNESCHDQRDDLRRCARHGSTRYIWTKDQLSAAIRYVVSGQGAQFAVFEAP